MRTAPCKGCTKREFNCHSKCDDYLEFKVIHEKETEMIYKAKKSDELIMNYKAQTVEKYFRKHSKKI